MRAAAPELARAAAVGVNTAIVTPAPTFTAWPASAPLSTYVECIWFAKSPADGRLERVLPNGAVELILNLGKPQRVVEGSRYRRFQRAWVAGLQTGPLTITDEEGADLVGVRFRPGGMSPWLGLPLAELTDGVEETDAVDRQLPGVDLVARLACAPDDAARRALVEAALLHSFRSGLRPGLIHAALKRLQDSRCTSSIRSLAQHLGVSHKHLITRFHEEVGIGPMRLARILRFHRLMLVLQTQERPAWAHLAANLGFSDQSHLVRDVREFSGYAPSELFGRRTDSGMHLWEDERG